MQQSRLSLAAGAIALAVIVAYAPAIRAPFLFDDIGGIQRNATIRALWPMSQALHPPARESVSGRPVVNYTLAVNYALNRWLGVDQRSDPDGPNKTVGYHVFNLVLHLFSGLLLFAVVRRTLIDGRWSRRARPADETALVVAALWLLHPIQTEAVDYVIQRTELLAAACYLATLYCSIRAWDAATVRATRAWSALAVGVCLAGAASKETMVSAPIAVMLYDRAFRAPSWRELFSRRDRVLLYVALWTTLVWLVTSIVTSQRAGTVGFSGSMTWYEYLYTSCWAIAHYLRLVLWPNALTIDYGVRPLRGLLGVPGAILLSAAAAGTIVAWFKGARWLWLGFLGACFFLLLAPSSSVVPILLEIAAERRMYLALACVLIVAVVSMRRVPLAVFAGVALMLAGSTFVRSKQYAHPEALWREVISRQPENPRGYLGVSYVMLHERPPRAAEAEPLLLQTLALDPTSLPALRSLTGIAMQTGRLDMAKPLLERQLALDPQSSYTAAQLGMVLVRLGDTARAGPYLERANLDQLADDDSTGATIVGYAAANMAMRRWARAASAFERAHQMRPERADILMYLSDALNRAGRSADAARYLNEARALPRQ